MNRLLIFFVGLVLINCENKNEDCSTVICEAVNYQVKLTSKNDGENIVLTEQLTEDDFSITSNENEQIDLFVRDGILIVYPENEINGNHKLSFKSSLIEYSYEFLKEGNGCCDWGNLSGVDVVDNTFVVDEKLLEIFLD
ncbi:hypothetical protein JQC67_12425 [Aurantibacter crassamenti]|uniref:hypothetical protein n=1 Tax=Aurantibacter crassamenti TaxID=1837375 RepID=UPI00193AA2E4|nr:hypothetical protein [Aurantibacter crassamenti]MBM1106948.1 hypothetical protein [Aurantibacter crassamenti]